MYEAKEAIKKIKIFSVYKQHGAYVQRITFYDTRIFNILYNEGKIRQGKGTRSDGGSSLRRLLFEQRPEQTTVSPYLCS